MLSPDGGLIEAISATARPLAAVFPLFVICVIAHSAVHGQSPIAERLADLECKEWTDPSQAAADDPDFLVQGEYTNLTEQQRYGVQVVALGEGKFDAYLLEGGLPGAGWDRGHQRIKLTGGRRDRSIELGDIDSTWQARISDGQINLLKDGAVFAELPRIERQSPTLGMDPPEKAIILFDGKSTDEWLDGRIENGCLLNNDIKSKRDFKDYQLHLEFRTPYKPYARGQRRGNSGIYQQGRFEIQVLDSFGLEGKQNECGGIYSIAPPLVNACLPPLTWQTYDIDFTAARFDESGKTVEPAKITARLNGVLIHDEQPLPHTTTAAPTKSISTTEGPLFIQHHRNTVMYRNIWVVPQ